MRVLQEDGGISISTLVTNLNLYISEQGNPNGISILNSFLYFY